jgi:uncharacterized membrane protein
MPLRAWSEEPGQQAGPGHWRLVRRCALTPDQLILSYAVVVVVSASTAILFSWHGIWVVAAFCLLQILLAGAMYLSYLIHAIDGERITLGNNGELAIEVVNGLRSQRYVLNCAWSRLERAGRNRDRLWLCCSRTRIEVATQLRPGEKRRIERELRQALAAWQSGHQCQPVPE